MALTKKRGYLLQQDPTTVPVRSVRINMQAHHLLPSCSVKNVFITHAGLSLPLLER